MLCEDAFFTNALFSAGLAGFAIFVIDLEFLCSWDIVGTIICDTADTFQIVEAGGK